MARVSDILGNRTEIYFVHEDMTVHEAARYVRDRGVRATAVCADNGRLLGVISQSDISDKVAAENRCPAWMKVTEIMKTELVKVAPETGIEECLRLMEQHGIYHLLVEDSSERYHGMISALDLLRVMASDYKARAELLENWAFPPV